MNFELSTDEVLLCIAALTMATMEAPNMNTATKKLGMSLVERMTAVVGGTVEWKIEGE